MEYEPRKWIVPKGRHEPLRYQFMSPHSGLGLCRLSVYTRGYNMPSRWDYCRLKAILRTRRVINVTLGAKGDYFFLFDLGFRFFAFDLVFDLPDDCLEEVLELPAFDFDFDLSFAFAFDLCFAFEDAISIGVQPSVHGRFLSAMANRFDLAQRIGPG